MGKFFMGKLHMLKQEVFTGISYLLTIYMYIYIYLSFSFTLKGFDER